MITHRHIASFPIQKLRPNPRNARTHPKKQIRQLANSIKHFGWTYPILTDEASVILAGHARHSAAELLGYREVPIIVVCGLNEAQKRSLTLADNKIAANSGWDRKLLAEELGELATLLPEFDLGLEITGFEPAEVDNLLGDLVDPEVDPADDLPEPQNEAISRLGDLWECGPHKLLCGDARSATDFRRLMSGESAAMVFTDPPFNVKVSSVQGRGKIQHREFVMASGEMSPAQFTTFLRRSLALAAAHSANGAIHFVFIDWRHVGQLLAAGTSVYSELKNIIVWVKPNAGQGSLYRSQHEFIGVFKNGEGPHQNNVELGRHGRNRSNVWPYPGVNSFRAGRMDELSVHPTVKPVALVADAMRDCSRRGDIVLDPFMGSGTTAMAAERVGRRAYGIELDPLYVDVAIRRWQAFTRRDAVLKESGKTFNEVSAIRAKRGGEP